MSELIHPDRAQLEHWLSDMQLENYRCGECDGVHINALQSLDGVVNSRIFLQSTGILFSSELEIRPMAILPLASDLGRISMDYINLKVFIDVVDDATPQLVIMTQLPCAAGIAQAQFAEFVSTTIDGKRVLAEECLRLDYLFEEPDQPISGASRSVH